MNQLWKYLLLTALVVAGSVISFRFAIDFTSYYKVAAWLAEGKYDLIYAPDGELRWFYYSPVGLFIFEVMGWFPIEVARWWWLSVHIASFVLFWWALFRLFPLLMENRCHIGWILVFIASINPIHTDFQTLNIQLVFAAIIVFGEWLSQQKSKWKNFWGGFGVALVASIKLYPLFMVVYYVLRKPKRMIPGMMGGFAFALIAPFIAYGIDNGWMFFSGFWANLRVYHGLYTLHANAENLSMASGIAVWLPSALKPFTNQIVTGSVLFFSGLFYFFAWTKKDSDPRSDTYFFAFALAAMAFLNSSSRPDHFIFYVPAYCVLVELWHAGKLSPLLKVGTVVSILLLAFTTDFVLRDKYLNDHVELLRIPVLGMLFLCLTTATAVLSRRRL